MATLAQIQAAVLRLLRAAGATGSIQLNSNTRERAFEAYVFALLIRAVQAAGGTVEVWGIQSGKNPNPLVFRGGPGRLGSRSQDFSFANCILNGKKFEIHLDVEFKGSSGAVHEIDVSIVDGKHADDIRLRSGRLPSTRHVHSAFECKFYDSALGVVLGRAFVGLLDDCGQLQAKAFLTNGKNSGLASYLGQKRRPDPFFELSPLNGSVETRLMSVIEQELRKWARVT